ncbi:hypothetical protein [Propionivibrio sp.]|uniref:hypothetical protein n=1 Tax=Propionivibrio sp. TaxID=2212460 RepID=UPI00260CFB03|nr:hypothetical protein [Propionivibrio sp.]
MLRWLLLLLICWAVFISAAMAFSPERVLGYAKHSHMWMRYLGKLFNITNETLSGIGTMRWVRVQGVIALVVTLLALCAWFRGPVSY